MRISNRGIYAKESSYFMNKGYLMIDFMGFKDIGYKVKRKKLNNINVTKDYIMKNSFTIENINMNIKKNSITILKKDISDQKQINVVDDSVSYEYIDFLVSVDVKNMKNFLNENYIEEKIDFINQNSIEDIEKIMSEKYNIKNYNIDIIDENKSTGKSVDGYIVM